LHDDIYDQLSLIEDEIYSEDGSDEFGFEDEEY
jgi:hypothetical protein